MKVLNVEINEQHVASAIAELQKRGRPFTFMVFQVALRRAGVPHDVSDRAADRVLQRLRKSGLVAYVKGHWQFTKEPTP